MAKKRRVRIVRTQQPKKRVIVVKRSRQKPFEEVLNEWHSDLVAFSWTQKVIGWNQEDVFVELQVALWKAWETYKPWRGDFGVYFWSIFLNHKGMQIRRHMAERRRAQEIPFTYEELMALSPLVYPNEVMPAPTEFVGTGVPHAVWNLLSIGYTADEVQVGLGLKKRDYYKIIHEWQTDAVWNWLTDEKGA